MAVEDWHTTFLRDYADCNYTDLEYIEEGESVAMRATIEAKGYDWRPFTQRVIEVFDFVEGGVAERRMYGMLPDLELDKPIDRGDDERARVSGRHARRTRPPGELLRRLPRRRQRNRDRLPRRQSRAIDSIYGIGEWRRRT